MSVSKDSSTSGEDDMEAGPSFCKFDPEELKKFQIKIGKKLPKDKGEIKAYDISQVVLPRRNDEGQRQIFDRPEIKEFYVKKFLKRKEKYGSKAVAVFLRKFQVENPSAEDSKTKKKSLTPERRRDKQSTSSERLRDRRSPLKKGLRFRERQDMKEDRDRRRLSRSGRRRSPIHSPDRKYRRSRERKRIHSESSDDSTSLTNSSVLEESNSNMHMIPGPMYGIPMRMPLSLMPPNGMMPMGMRPMRPMGMRPMRPMGMRPMPPMGMRLMRPPCVHCNHQHSCCGMKPA